MPNETNYIADAPVGAESTFSKGGVEFAITAFSGGEDGTRVDISTTKNHSKLRKKTYTVQKGTKVIARYTINAFSERANGLLASLRVNDEIHNVILSNSDTGYLFRCPTCIVESVPIESGGVGGVSTYRFTIAAQGIYDIRQGTTATGSDAASTVVDYVAPAP